MDTTLTAKALMAEQDKRITETISRLHTARYLIDCLNDETTFRKTPVIFER